MKTSPPSDCTYTNAGTGGGLTHDKLVKIKKKLDNYGTTRLGRWLNARQTRKAEADQILYGTSYVKQSWRSPFNPMRWILGPFKLEHIDPKKFLLKVNWAEKLK